MRKFNAIENEMMSLISALKKENEDIKMDIVRKKTVVFASFSWAMFALTYSAMYMH